MPASKLSFKENHLKLELEDVEFTAGTEVVKIGKLSAELDVNDLLRTKLPALLDGPPDGIIIMSFGDKKVHCIKEVREFTRMSLQEAKALIESVPNARIDATSEGERACVEFCQRIAGHGGHAELVRAQGTVPSVMDKLREMLSEALMGQPFA